MSEKVKAFDGDHTTFSTWYMRLRGKIRKKGMMIKAALKGQHPFTGLSHNEAKASRGITAPTSVLQQHGIVGINSPLAKTLGFATPNSTPTKESGTAKSKVGADEKYGGLLHSATKHTVHIQLPGGTHLLR